MSSLWLLSVIDISINSLLDGSGAAVNIKIKAEISVIINRDRFVLNAGAAAVKIGSLGGVEGLLPAVDVAVSWQARAGPRAEPE